MLLVLDRDFPDSRILLLYFGARTGEHGLSDIITQSFFKLNECLQAVYQERAVALAQALQSECGDRVVVNMPAGGMFLWVEVPVVEDTEELLDLMVAQKVRILLLLVRRRTFRHILAGISRPEAYTQNTQQSHLENPCSYSQHCTCSHSDTCCLHLCLSRVVLFMLQVVVVPGRYFSPRSDDPTYKCKFMRMAFANRTPEELQEASRRFAAVLDAYSACNRTRAA